MFLLFFSKQSFAMKFKLGDLNQAQAYNVYSKVLVIGSDWMPDDIKEKVLTVLSDAADYLKR